MKKYVDHMERTLHNLKIVGFLPKEQKRDPDIHGIFVPLRIALNDHHTFNSEQQSASIVELLEQYPHIVVLGDPGSGKSTAVRHLAWSHAKANQSTEELKDVVLLAGHPLPLRIELRLFMQDRKRNPDYSFLSYATEVLLGRENISINSLIFERLLQQKRMLVLFDGLDEVTTLDERKRLVEEIEHFAQAYPGNHILVTSRPVGYDLASCAQHLFTHSKVQNFDDDQIHQFLERWYTHVLGLSPLQYEDQQELETLFNTLKENQRLHKLAENPLLLTVITGLYRSQRLPEKRVQVYDRCAELLLETWAKLKGTDIRWKDMKLSKEDQFDCVAHLGFQLHKRSQEENNAQKNSRSRTDTATDVPARVMQREIEQFIRDQGLIIEVAEQRKEAERFLDLMRIEAGLIVERGTDENEESIYGFVHRTFQEYFAASDVYRRFTEDEDPIIIKDFLVEHLHDPHWSEVTLLLFGKLGRKRVTARLRQILEGEIKSRRSRYTNIIEQDLFFVCDCLAEDMPVETDLATTVISRLSRVIITTPFQNQSNEALRKFTRLTDTRQFASLARKELSKLATLSPITNTTMKIAIARTLYTTSPLNSEEKQLSTQLLLQLAQNLDLSIDDRVEAAEILYIYGSDGPREMLQQAANLLLQIAQHPNISIRNKIQAAEVLSIYGSAKFSKEAQKATQLLLQIIQNPDLSIKDRINAARSFQYGPIKSSEEIQKATQLLLQIIQNPDLSIEDRIEVAKALYYFDFISVDKRQQTTQIILQLMRLPDLSIEQRIRVADALHICSKQDSEEEKQAIQLLSQVAQQPNISTDLTIQAARALNWNDPRYSKEQRLATYILTRLAQRSSTPIKHVIQAIEALYHTSARSSNAEHLAALLCWQLAQDPRLPANQRLYIATIPITKGNANYLYKMQAIRLLYTLMPREQVAYYLEKKWRTWESEFTPEEISSVIEFIQKQLLPSKICNQLYNSLLRSVPQFHKIPDVVDSPS